MNWFYDIPSWIVAAFLQGLLLFVGVLIVRRIAYGIRELNQTMKDVLHSIQETEKVVKNQDRRSIELGLNQKSDESKKKDDELEKRKRMIPIKPKDRDKGF